jgi:hypothetical protein
MFDGLAILDAPAQVTSPSRGSRKLEKASPG